jgi:hypothetical protein
MTHLRFAGRPHDEQVTALETIVRGEPLLMAVLEGLRDLDLPDWLLVSGAIYNSVWNALTGRPSLTGIKDIDVIYFDDTDLSYEAEDKVIGAVDARFAQLPVPVEVRNQARVHLWFPKKFGTNYPQLTRAAQSLDYYASRTHAVAVRLDVDGTLDVVAPFGLNDIFSFRVIPNHALDNRKAHVEKGARAKAVWPELIVEPW